MMIKSTKSGMRNRMMLIAFGIVCLVQGATAMHKGFIGKPRTQLDGGSEECEKGTFSWLHKFLSSAINGYGIREGIRARDRRVEREAQSEYDRTKRLEDFGDALNKTDDDANKTLSLNLYDMLIYKRMPTKSEDEHLAAEKEELKEHAKNDKPLYIMTIIGSGGEYCQLTVKQVNRQRRGAMVARKGCGYSTFKIQQTLRHEDGKDISTLEAKNVNKIPSWIYRLFNKATDRITLVKNKRGDNYYKLGLSSHGTGDVGANQLFMKKWNITLQLKPITPETCGKLNKEVGVTIPVRPAGMKAQECRNQVRSTILQTPQELVMELVEGYATGIIKPKEFMKRIQEMESIFKNRLGVKHLEECYLSAIESINPNLQGPRNVRPKSAPLSSTKYPPTPRFGPGPSRPTGQRPRSMHKCRTRDHEKAVPVCDEHLMRQVGVDQQMLEHLELDYSSGEESDHEVPFQTRAQIIAEEHPSLPDRR